MKGCPDIRLLHTTSYPGRSFQEKRNRSHEQVRKRDIYSQKSLIEICSDSDWAADRETRQSVSCGAIFVNGNMIHFQSKRQRSISLSSCESETIAAVSIMSEGIFIQKLIGRLTGIEPEVRLYIDSSSSRQLISRKGLGKARHLDVNLLWIQKMKNVLVKAIKGTENPADLGTKALSKDKIKKYMKALGYRGEFIEEDEMQTRRVTKMKSISVGMIAKIVAVLMSEGFSVEATRIGEVFVESKPCCMSGLYWLILICLGMFICMSMTMTCSSAAVLVQAVGPGKGKEAEASKEKEGKEKKEEKGSMMGDEKKSEDQSRPSPEEQAEQLRAMALESKRNRIQAVIAAGGKPAEEEPAEEMDVESEKDEREEKEKEEKEKKEAPKEADDSESSSSSSSTEEEEPTNAQVDKKETVEATDAPEDKKETIEATDAPEDKKEAVEATDAPEDKEEAIDEEQVRNEAIRRFDERFINALKPHGQKASDFTHCISRTVGGMVHSLMSVFLEPSECEEETLRALQALGELNLETITNLKEGLEKSQEFKRCLEEKLLALKKEKDEYEQMYEKKVGRIKTRLSELGAEARVSEKGLNYHEGVDDFCTEVFKLLRSGQDDPDAKVFGWKVRKFDLSHEGIEKLREPTRSESILMNIIGDSDITPQEELARQMRDFEGKMKAVEKPKSIMIEVDDEGKDEEIEEEKKAVKRAIPMPKRFPFTAVETKAMPKKRPYEGTDMNLEKKMKEEPSEKSLIEEYRVPQKYLDVKVDQSVWDFLGSVSRQRLLKEHPPRETEACFACGRKGHRSYYCPEMVETARKLSSFFNQAKGGERPNQTVFCSCCWLHNLREAYKKSRDLSKVSGWHTHPRSQCTYRQQCQLKEDAEIVKMPYHEVKKHLVELGLIQEGEKRKEIEPRTVSMSTAAGSEEQEKKKRKKEKKEEDEKRRKAQEKEEMKKIGEERKKALQKAEEERLKKEKEEQDRLKKESEEPGFKEIFRSQTSEKYSLILHGYLFEKDYRCAPQKMEQQAKYEKALPYEVLRRTPNYISRLEETNAHNKR